MSTFLTQGLGGFGKPAAKQPAGTLAPPEVVQNALMHAPFIKPVDKMGKKDVAELSFSDFQPKRFALNYDPPMIILEYMVPSTGKLYHHKMKLRTLKADTSTDEVIEYLRKRHPLYFIAHKISVEQITDLINRLKFKIKQLGIITADPPAQSHKKENMASAAQVQKPVVKAEAPSSLLGPLPSLTTGFKSGSQLPAIGGKQPSILAFSENSKAKHEQLFSQVKADLAKANNDEEEYGDEEDQYEEEEEDEDDADFDANELLNLTDYQNKRKASLAGATSIYTKAPISSMQHSGSGSGLGKGLMGKSAATKVGKDGAIEIENSEDEEEDDGWGNDWGAPAKKDFDYDNTNLNKLSQAELAAHKKKMDEKFHLNQLKPGDAGFQYDKRIDFSKNVQSNGAAEWDEEEDVDNYFDDDFM